jgi:hypothetical protein
LTITKGDSPPSPPLRSGKDTHGDGGAPRRHLPAFYTDLTLEKENIRQIQRAHLVCPLLAVRVSSTLLMMVVVVVNGGIGEGRLVTSNISKFCSHVVAYTNM